MSNKEFNTIITTLKNKWESKNKRDFSKYMYMRRNSLEEVSTRYVDAFEMIQSWCDDYMIKDSLVNLIFTISSKYIDGMVPKNAVEDTLVYCIQLVEDIHHHNKDRH